MRAATTYGELPASAVEHMGIAPNQNVFVRMVLRHVEHTLPDAEANELRARIDAALHPGNSPGVVLSQVLA